MSTPVPVPVPDDPVAPPRELHFFWIVDYSASMEGKNIATVNSAIRDVIPQIQNAVAANSRVKCFMRAIKFSNDAGWHVGPQPVPVEQFSWPDLMTLGGTSTAKAIRLLASELTLDKMPRRGIPPVCILLSDGKYTDEKQEYDGAIKQLLDLPWGKHAVRLVIAIGENETDYDEQELLKFVSHKEMGVLKAHNPAELIKHIQTTSLSAVREVTKGKGKGGSVGNAHVVSADEPAPTDQTEGFEP